MTNLKKGVGNAHKFIDYKIGLAGAIVMGGVVFGINYFSTHNLAGSFTASLKQGAYTFIFGGTLMKACEYIATTVKKQTLAIVLSVAIPSVFTLILTFTMHNLKGTPKPFESTIPTTIIIPATAIWGYRKRLREKIDTRLKGKD
ncbi:MAG: hypothetical protein U5K79_16250 [Cyclobacteriaceae bacterium]|nr:hypothetical protein [Cyclobacteriaceae bacterium]